MEFHIEKLNKLCRICGGVVKPKLGYTNPKMCADYSDVLREQYGILQSEDAQTYPKKLCVSCKQKIERLQKSGKTGSSAYRLFDFKPHETFDCWLCHRSGSSLPAGHSKTSCSHLKYFDNVFHKYSFIKLPSQDVRTYSIIEVNQSIGPYNKISVAIKADFTWYFFVLNKIVNYRNSMNLPEVLNDSNIETFCESVKKLTVCLGNKTFPEVIEDRLQFLQPFPDTDKKNCVAYVEAENGHTQFIKSNFNVIRAKDCEIVMKGETICTECLNLKNKLYVYKKRLNEKGKEIPDSDPQSNTNIRYLKREDLEERYRKLQLSKQEAMQKLVRASSKLNSILEQSGVSGDCVTGSDHDIFCDIINKNTPSLEEGTPQWLLWEQQKEAANKKDRRGMRWHPLVLRWCLSIYSTSPAAYRQIASKQNKFFILPHVNTLKKHINFMKPTTGFPNDIIDKIVTESHLSDLEDYQKNVSLTFDEIKIKSGLVYKRGSGKIVGFTEMGELNSEIRDFANKCDDQQKDDFSKSDFASYVLVFMVRGIFTSFCSTLGYFASTGVTGDQLCPLIIEATRILEALGFKVRNWTCDGATPNRKLFQIASVGDNFNMCLNVFNKCRNIYFVSDPPHLIKTLRNNIESSHGNLNSRNLVKNGKHISWAHIVSLYEWDLGMDRATLGLRLCHKLKEEHIRLTPQHRMSVKYAVQVISHSVAAALKLRGLPETVETANLIELFDNAFDCLNVSRIKSNDKPYRQPYRSVNDDRFEFLEGVVKYLDEWEAEIESVPGISRDEKQRLIISHQTITGWKKTISSFVSLAKELLQEAGDGKFLLSEKFSQDPLEEHFSRHRRLAGCNDNPSLPQFQQQEVALHAVSSELITDLRGNTSGRQVDRTPIDISDTRLPRKRK